MVEISRSPVPSNWDLNVSSAGARDRSGLRPACRQRATQLLAALAQELHLGRVGGWLVVLGVVDLLVGEGQLEAVAEGEQGGLGHLLGLVGDHLALARDAHAVALDGLGQDDRRLAGVAHGGVVGGVDLLLVVAAAVEQPDLVVGHVAHPLEHARVASEEVLAHVGAVARLERLVVAVDTVVHDLDQGAVDVGLQERVPPRAPDDLDHVPARAAEVRLELLDDLAVAAHRPVEALKVAVDHPDEVVQLLAPGQGGRAHRLGLVHLAVAQERPHLARGGLGHPARLQVLHEARLVDRGDGPDAQRDRGELPELGHQPRMRVGAQAALDRDLLAEAVELCLGQPALEIGARVVARRGVALEVDEVATVLVRRPVPEVVEADLHERGQRLVGGDVPAELRGDLVGAQHHADGVPAHDRAQAALDHRVTRERRLQRLRDGVHIRGVEAGDRAGAGVLGALDDPLQQVPRAVGSVVGDNRVQRLQPLGRLYRIGVDGLGLGSVAIRSRCLCLDAVSHGLGGIGGQGVDYTSAFAPHGRGLAAKFGVA